LAGWSRSREAVAAAFVLAGCEPETIVRAELEIVVDTDVPLVTQLDDPLAAPTTVRVDRLRVDVYDETGTRWLESRDFLLPDPAMWPASFGVRSDPDDEARRFRVRLRAYRTGRAEPAFERDAAGEIVLDASGAPVPVRDPSGQPAVEPRVAFTVDRVVPASLAPGERRRILVSLLGDCMGVPADVAAGASCVRSRDEPLAEPAEEPEPEAPGPLPPSRVGHWPRAFGAACAGAPRTPRPDLFEDELCIPGGVFHLGDDRVIGVPCAPADPCDGVPERLVFLSPFWMDRYPVTVARYRAALLDPVEPLRPPATPVLHGDPKYPGSSQHCTWTGVDPTNLAGYAYDPAHDARPVNCVGREAARAFCAWAGGELPTEAQWELVATAVGRPFETLHPWGDAPAACAGVQFGRAPSAGLGSTECIDEGFGPGGVSRVDAGLGATEVVDWTPPPRGETAGAAHMGALVANVLRDAFEPYDGACWAAAPRLDPSCTFEAGRYSARGGTFLRFGWQLKSAQRGGLGASSFSYEIGFRCVRGAGEEGRVR
jgi:formylglycine-generating enzyme required for sulfatase activity